MHDPWLILTILVTTALIGATISGMIGMAGGMLLLVVMSSVGLPLDVVIPIHGVVQLFSNGTRVVAFLKYVRWRPVLMVVVVGAPMPLLGMWLNTLLDENVTRLFIGLIVLYATWAPKKGMANLPEWLAFSLVGFLAGTFGVVIGATGPIVAPFMLRKGWKKEEMIATSAVCQTYSHIIKIIAFGFTGFAFTEHYHLIVPMCAAVIAGTWIGRWLLLKINENWFIVIYRGAITLLALRLIVKALWM
jgi:uncharacterized membrane protein YfcA